ncbi:hypothetical protein ISCGN_032165 [Ixodes scapularis]
MTPLCSAWHRRKLRNLLRQKDVATAAGHKLTTQTTTNARRRISVVAAARRLAASKQCASRARCLVFKPSRIRSRRKLTSSPFCISAAITDVHGKYLRRCSSATFPFVFLWIRGSRFPC